MLGGASAPNSALLEITACSSPKNLPCSRCNEAAVQASTVVGGHTPQEAMPYPMLLGDLSSGASGTDILSFGVVALVLGVRPWPLKQGCDVCVCVVDASCTALNVNVQVACLHLGAVTRVPYTVQLLVDPWPCYRCDLPVDMPIPAVLPGHWLGLRCVCSDVCQTLAAPWPWHTCLGGEVCCFCRLLPAAHLSRARRPQNISPQLLLSAFLPIILFSGAFAFDFAVAMKLISSSLLLAGGLPAAAGVQAVTC